MARSLLALIDLKTDRLIERFDPRLWFIRLLISAMFLESGFDKLFNWSRYEIEVASHHIPWPAAALLAAMLTEFFGSAALLTGVALAPALLALALYTLIINAVYFDFWNQTGLAAVVSRKEFLKNLAVAGGLLAYLVDALRDRFPSSARP